ncbi:hypothetical protein Nepgr_032109 [Nepenthes gracilis]|uniref:Uncharacterized protein n=1 Tax=Nepenthes gracilis TaxID=150966 RepID=A0AAD3TJE4_NEPGR|nr:hypothetical protein Nepgr_032109 [Nepenthes gracilis]
MFSMMMVSRLLMVVMVEYLGLHKRQKYVCKEGKRLGDLNDLTTKDEMQNLKNPRRVDILPTPGRRGGSLIRTLQYNTKNCEDEVPGNLPAS